MPPEYKLRLVLEALMGAYENSQDLRRAYLNDPIFHNLIERSRVMLREHSREKEWRRQVQGEFVEPEGPHERP